MNIFVTGGTGFLGSRVVKQLTAAGHSVTILTRRYPDWALRCTDKIHYTNTWPSDFKDYDMIYNLAGVLAKKDTTRDDMVKAHVNLPRELVARAHPYIPVVHMSTAYVEAETSHKDYIETKKESERIFCNYFSQLTLVRPGPIFGPGDLHHLPLFKMIRKLGFWCPIPGAYNRFCPTHVDEVAYWIQPNRIKPGLLRLAGSPVTIKEFMQEAATWLNTGTPFIKIPPIVKKDFFGIDRVFESDIELQMSIADITNDAVLWYASKRLV